MALPITQQLVARVAHSLGTGGWRFTLRQLWYACCADAEAPPSHAYANGEIGVGVLLLLASLIALPLRPLFVVLFAVGAVLVALGGVRRLTTHPVPGRVLAMSFDEFARRFGDMPLQGLVRDDDVAVTDVTQASDSVVVCDTRDTATAVRCNATIGGLDGVTVVDAASLPHTTVASRVLALHDASPRGCALPLDLRDRGLNVVDCGLRPSRVNGAQVIEGAPARLPRDLRDELQPDEIEWLLSGRRVEAATLAPRELLALVKEMLAAAP